jgi:hypothetical protein
MDNSKSQIVNLCSDLKKQSQFPKGQMNASVRSTRSYENNAALRLREEEAKQSQFLYQRPHSSFILMGLCRKGRYMNLSLVTRESNDQIREHG